MRLLPACTGRCCNRVEESALIDVPTSEMKKYDDE